MSGMDNIPESGGGCPECGGRFTLPASRNRISCQNGHTYRVGLGGVIEQVTAHTQPETADELAEIAGSFYEPCESCGTPVRPEPANPEVQYAGLPVGVSSILYEDWQAESLGVSSASWHNPKRCREAKLRAGDPPS